MVKVCKICGENFVDKASHIQKRVTCSRDCKKTHCKSSFCGPNNAYWKGGLKQVLCVFCGEKYSIPLCRVKTSKYCSVLCKTRAETKVRVKTRKLKIIRFCKQCGTNNPIKKGRIFCEKCRAERKAKSSLIFLRCINCGELFQRSKRDIDRGRNKCCSSLCYKSSLN